MIEYLYIVKCPNCEDEQFSLFDDAKCCAMGCISSKPIITQVEITRNDFGECTDSYDLGTVWSWEDAVGRTDDEPEANVFTKGDFAEYNPDSDPEFEELDNTLDAAPDNFRKSSCVTESTLRVGTHLTFDDRTPITKDELYDQLVNRNAEVEIDIGDGHFDPDIHFDGGVYSNSTLIVEYDSSKSFNIYMLHYSDDGEAVEDIWYGFETLSFEELWEELVDFAPKALVEESCRKPIPEGMTIEQLVEEMEENEDTVECVCCQELYPKEDCKHDEKHGWICSDCADEVVECTWCEELYDRSECRKEVSLGWLCDRCEEAIKSRGETLTFRENNYWDFLDEE